MKKTSINPSDDKDTIASLMTLISEGIKKAEKVKDPNALRDWLELGCSALEKFGGDDVLEDPEFRQVLENSSLQVKKPGELRQPPLDFEENFPPEAVAYVLNSFIRFCDVIIAGNDCAVALIYSEEYMFSPIIISIERNVSASALVWAAGKLSVPVVKNVMLAGNLASYGKVGEGIPDASSQEVSLVFARLSSARPQWRSKAIRKDRQAAKNPRPLSVEMGESLFALTGEGPGREKLLAKPLNATRKKLAKLLGFEIPVFRVSHSSGLKDDEYRVLFRGIEAGRGRLEIGWYTADRNFLSGGVFPAHTAIPLIMKIPENLSGAAKAASQVMVRHVDKIIQKHAPDLLGRDEVEALLDAAEEKYPVVTGEVKSLLSLGIIRDILQNLVSEGVSIQHMSVILETLADWGNFGTASSETIVEQIRQALKRQICLEYTDDSMKLRVFNLEPKLEKKLAEHSPMLVTETDKSDCAEKDEFERLAELIVSSVEEMKVEGYPPVILCSPKIRSCVKEATRRKLPELAVLSYLEIPSGIIVVPLGEIGLSAEEPG